VSPRKLDDAALAEALRRDDAPREVIEEAYRRFFPIMLYAAARVLQSPNARAEDVAQETLTRILLDGSLAHLRDVAKIRAFLESAATRAAIDLVRHLGREVPTAAPVEPLENEVERKRELDETRARVEEAMALLEPDDRQLLSLRFLEEQPLGEIARRLQVGYAAAGQRLSRALARARKALQSPGKTPNDQKSPTVRQTRG
jgi:RNA polymerase sigma factor (sigma-70 family)